MSANALLGGVKLVLKPQALQRIILPLVAFSAGSSIGGATFPVILCPCLGGVAQALRSRVSLTSRMAVRGSRKVRAATVIISQPSSE